MKYKVVTNGKEYRIKFKSRWWWPVWKYYKTKSKYGMGESKVEILTFSELSGALRFIEQLNFISNYEKSFKDISQREINEAIRLTAEQKESKKNHGQEA